VSRLQGDAPCKGLNQIEKIGEKRAASFGNCLARQSSVKKTAKKGPHKRRQKLGEKIKGLLRSGIV
jgi:hypothetical protein